MLRRWWAWIGGTLKRREVAVVKEAKFGHRYVFTGHDESLGQQALVRRAHADRIKQEALKLTTRDDARSRLQRVK